MVTAANALADRWISLFGCPHSFPCDQGRNFESKLFEQLMQLLEMDKTRTLHFHQQPNIVIEKLKKNNTKDDSKKSKGRTRQPVPIALFYDGLSLFKT